MKAIIICGSREWDGEVTIAKFIKTLPAGTVVIHGDCRGADRVAGSMARMRNLPVIPMPAQWDKLGGTAGPARNFAMLTILRTLQRQGYDVSVHAFQLGRSRGTQNMLDIAEREGIKTEVHRTERDDDAG